MGVSSSSTGCGGSRRAGGLQGVKRAATGRPGTSRRGTSPTGRPNGNSLEASLLAIRAPQDPQKVLQELGALQPKQLSGALLALQRITEKPIAEFAPQPSTLRDVAAKLKLVNEATPDYWPTEWPPNSNLLMRQLRTTGPRCCGLFSSRGRGCLPMFPLPGRRRLSPSWVS